jgi:alkylation response protein AidB-like acyl-CoA dehydrogenase
VSVQVDSIARGREEGLAGFRAAVRGWIEERKPAELAAVADWTVPHLGGSTRGPTAAAKSHPAFREWEATLRENNLICPHWPSRFGGSDFNRLELTIFAEECFRAKIPRVDRGHGETMVGPAVLAHGAEDQKEWFLPRIVDGLDSYCQGFSEPNSGSDLASLSTAGRVDGTDLVIDGQKTWTSRADEANMIYTLCRTEPGSRRHTGISFVLVPMTDNAVEIRPIAQITGAAEFFETFFDGARAPLFNAIGGLGNGWHVAMTTLSSERGGERTMLRHLGLGKEFEELVADARERGALEDPLMRRRVAEAYVKLEQIRLAGLRYAASLASEASEGPEESVNKLLWSEYHRDLGELALDLLGPDGALASYGDGVDSRTDHWADTFLAGRADTIYSGTSEIQRRIVAQRSLGMPRG